MRIRTIQQGRIRRAGGRREPRGFASALPPPRPRPSGSSFPPEGSTLVPVGRNSRRIRRRGPTFPNRRCPSLALDRASTRIEGRGTGSRDPRARKGRRRQANDARERERRSERVPRAEAPRGPRSPRRRTGRIDPPGGGAATRRVGFRARGHPVLIRRTRRARRGEPRSGTASIPPPSDPVLVRNPFPPPGPPSNVGEEGSPSIESRGRRNGDDPERRT